MISMILLFTDFSLTDPYVGQMHRQILQANPDATVIDLLHTLPAFNAKAASYLLPAYCPPIENAIYCCIVDPGVGSDRAPILFKVNGSYYLGPDNGLFESLARQYSIENTQQIDWRPEIFSDTFHGRDIFAPVAAKILNGDKVDASPISLQRNPEWPDDLDEIVFLDHFGNIITGRRGDTVHKDATIEINGYQLKYAKTFSDTSVGSGFWYNNSNGLLEIAVNKGSASGLYQATIGDVIRIII